MIGEVPDQMGDYVQITLDDVLDSVMVSKPYRPIGVLDAWITGLDAMTEATVMPFRTPARPEAPGQVSLLS